GGTGGAGADGEDPYKNGIGKPCTVVTGDSGTDGSLYHGGGDDSERGGCRGGGGYYGGGEGGGGGLDECTGIGSYGGGGGGSSYTGGAGVSDAVVNDGPAAPAALDGNGEVVITYAEPQAAQLITFTSTAPNPGVVGTTYTPQAT